jgi:lipopolysaccharide heptosyltransferase II
MIGDLVMLSPAIHALRSSYPDSEISILGQPASIAVYKQHPGITELIPFDRSRGDLNIPAFMQAVKTLRSRRFDLGIVSHNSFGSALMTRLGGVRQRIGYSAEGRDFLLSRAVRGSTEREHLISNKLRLIAALGIEVEDRREEVFINEEAAKAWIKDKLGPNFGRNRPIVTISLGSTVDHKQWTGSELNRLLNMLPVNGCDLVFVGTPKERALFEGVYSYNNTVVDLVGETTIEELTWVLDRAALHIGPDSGPMHLAIGRGTPVIALFGGTDPARCGPFCAENARVIRSHRCCTECQRKFGRVIVACTHTIGASEVFDAALDLLPALGPKL